MKASPCYGLLLGDRQAIASILLRDKSNEPILDFRRSPEAASRTSGSARCGKTDTADTHRWRSKVLWDKVVNHLLGLPDFEEQNILRHGS